MSFATSNLAAFFLPLPLVSHVEDKSALHAWLRALELERLRICWLNGSIEAALRARACAHAHTLTHEGLARSRQQLAQYVVWCGGAYIPANRRRCCDQRHPESRRSPCARRQPPQYQAEQSSVHLSGRHQSAQQQPMQCCCHPFARPTDSKTSVPACRAAHRAP